MKFSESINMIVDNTDSDRNCSSSVELDSETNYSCSSDVKDIKDESSHPISILNSTESLIGIKSMSDTDSNTSSSDMPHKNENIQHNQSQIALAWDAVENKRVELVSHMSSFLVQGSNQKTYSVQPYPKEVCNCPSTTTCWHIIATKLSIGIINTIPAKCTINLSQLKRNSRRRVDNKSGRKRPRPDDTDIEIVPAPESKENDNETKSLSKRLNISKEDADCFAHTFKDLIDLESDTNHSAVKYIENSIVGKVVN